MSTAAGQFQSVSQVVTAIQWTGENLAAVQQALYPSSPLLDGRAEGKNRVLTVMVRNSQNEKLYPSLGRQTKEEVAQPGDWLVWLEPDDLRVVGDTEFQRSYVAIAPERYLVDREVVPPAPAPVLQAPHPRALSTSVEQVDRQPEETEEAKRAETLKDA